MRFTAPATGTFNIDSKWRIAHAAPVVWGVFRNHATLVASGSSTSAGNGYNNALALTAGETLDFVIGLTGSGYGGATTGIVVKVTRQDTSCPGQCADANGNGVWDQYDISKPVDKCANVTCSASDQCHDAGTCDSSSGVCSNPAKANGATCTDGNACTTGDSCQAGSCQASGVLGCDDQNPCTVDSYSATAGCVHVASAVGQVCATGKA